MYIFEHLSGFVDIVRSKILMQLYTKLEQPHTFFYSHLQSPVQRME